MYKIIKKQINSAFKPVTQSTATSIIGLNQNQNNNNKIKTINTNENAGSNKKNDD